MKWLADCVGYYACGPQNGTPAGEVIVKTASDLAQTGGLPWWVYPAVFLGSLLVGFGLSFLMAGRRA